MIKVGIIGVGFIGGSLGLALRGVRRKGKRLYHVVGWGRSQSRIQLAKRRGAIDQVAPSLRKVAADSDIVVLCVPVQKMRGFFKKLAPYAQSNLIVTDAGSVKTSILKDAGRFLKGKSQSSFVGSHPIAGSEKAGVRHAKPHLFQGAVTVITPQGAKKKSVRTVEKMWKDVGSITIQMKPEHHDRMLALTSHLPHLLAFSLMGLIQRVSPKAPLVKKLTGTAFRDVTRIAGSDPTVWSGIIDLNRQEIKRSCREFCQVLNNLNTMPTGKIPSHLSRVARFKNSWIKM